VEIVSQESGYHSIQWWTYLLHCEHAGPANISQTEYLPLHQALSKATYRPLYTSSIDQVRTSCSTRQVLGSYGIWRRALEGQPSSQHNVGCTSD
jgi:hypothetical protein